MIWPANLYVEDVKEFHLVLLINKTLFNKMKPAAFCGGCHLL